MRTTIARSPQPSPTEFATVRHRKPSARTLGQLTSRQLEIVRLARDGMRPAAIARTLNLSIETVRRTIKDACLTLDVHGLPELLAEARRRRLLPSE